MAAPMPNAVNHMHRAHLEPNVRRNVRLNPEPDPEFYDAATHIFLPKQLPTHQNDNLEQTEQYLIQTFTNSVKKILSELSFPPLKPVETMLEKWILLQPTSKNRSHFLIHFPNEIEALKVGNTIPIYIRNQNSTLLITKHSDQTIYLSTFRPSLPSEIVMSNILGAHVMFIPETMETIQNIGLLKSQPFAKQLYEIATGDINKYLREFPNGENKYKSARDVADPKLVSDWIIGLLVPHQLTPDKLEMFNNSRVQKKYRNHVSFYESEELTKSLPFRRSGMYMALKGALQLKLLEILGSKTQAKLVYKIIILSFLVDTANRIPNIGRFTIDQAAQILAKIGKRVQKLAQMSDETVSTPKTLSSIVVRNLKTKCLENVASAVNRLTEKMKTAWDHVSSSSNRSLIILPSLHDENDCYHRIPNSDNFIHHLKSLSTSTLTTNQAGVISDAEVFRRYKNVDNILAVGNTSLPTSSAYVWIYDTENFLKYNCNDGDITPAKISQLLLPYFKNAFSHYGRDPLGKSQIYLVSLKGLEILDKIITNEYPLLLKYKPEVNINLFDNLLLPFKKDMDLLDKLLGYFSTREKNAEYAGILSSSSVKANSFCVNFAKNCNEMTDLHKKISDKTNSEIEERKELVKTKNKLCKSLQKRIDDLNNVQCTCRTLGTLILEKCEKCQLPDKLESSRKSVYAYRKPLPSDENMQWAIIFEMLIPKNFAIFRDYLAHIKYEIWGDKIFDGESNTKHILWVEDEKLASFTNGWEKHSKNIQLTSPSNISSSSISGSLDVLNNKPEDYIVEKGLGCAYYCSIVQNSKRSSVQKDCSFQLKDTSNNEPYFESNLQVTVESTNHTQNSILARQAHCHKNLSLEEFLAFGSLRAGDRIQMRNLYESIYSGKLSLEQEPVLALILQTVWQVGPRNAKNNERESHLDFSGKDTQFAEEFLDMLNKLVQANEKNYSNPLTVMVAIIITRRISDLSEALSSKCYDLMKRWRSMMSTWITEIEMVLDKPETAGIQGGVASLRKNLLEIVLCSMLSYKVGSRENVNAVMRDQDDVVYWMKTLFQWNQLVDQPILTSTFFEILQNFAKTIPLELNLESNISARNGLVINSLKTFISQKWEKASRCDFKGYSTPFPNEESLVLVQYSETDPNTGTEIIHKITFDFIRGEFLVNGFSESNLPLEVKDNKLFQLYFNKAANLRIRRDNARLAKTIVPFYDRHYEFYQTDNTLIITELNHNQSMGNLVLVDPEVFQKVLSEYFIENYTHWLDISKLCVYFRPKSSFKDHLYHYTLHLVPNGSNLWTLLEEKTQSFVLSIKSTGFQQVTKALERLELEEFINVTFQRESSTTTATLRRHNLRFTLNFTTANQERCLESVEYPGFSIAPNQSELGTFLGLEHGLLLKKGEKRLILVPHSSIQHSTGPYHQSCLIQLKGQLRQPPCFAYEVDDVLKRLKAHNSKSAWLYLAALHAVTSSSFFPDPFTELTGTEMAIHILQSACVWSCSPYDPESLTTLNLIKDLSPKRKWYRHKASKNNGKDGKKSMEITIWPEGLYSMVAYDGYRIIVDYLINESRKLAMLYENEEPQMNPDQNESTEDYSEYLYMRGYLRSLSFYNPAAALTYPQNFTGSQITQIGQIATDHSLSIRELSEEFNIRNMQNMALASLNKSLKTLKTSRLFKKDNLAQFLITTQPLDENSPLMTLDYKESFEDVLRSDFRSNWLRLYTMATLCRQPEDYHLFGIILSALAYRGNSLEQLANLHCISLFSAVYQFPIVPSYLDSNLKQSTYYSRPASNDYNVNTVHNILTKNAKEFTALEVPTPPTKPSTYNHYGITTEEFEDLHQRYRTERQKYEEDLTVYRTQKTAYENHIKTSSSALSIDFKNRFWPCPNIPPEAITDLLETNNFESEFVVRELNENIKFWYRNHILKVFIAQVQSILNYIWDNLENLDKAILFPFPLTLQNFITTVYEERYTIATKNEWETLESYLDKTKAEKVEECGRLFQNGRSEYAPSTNGFLNQRIECNEKAEEIRENLVHMLTSTIPSKIIYQSGITPRLSPISILKYLVTKGRQVDTSNVIFPYAGALGVLYTHLKRLHRCIRSQNEVDLKREQDNPGHSNWSPKSHPEWLLLELELDIMIRPIQVEVANQMIKMPGGPNGVTQLNMGEGKTSVIVPMLCATLAQKNSQLCRVTVLSSMFKMNLKSLSFSIGGLLNKRIYSVPCRRDMNIDENCVNQIQQAYKQCLESEDVVLTLPEYRLSFRLLAYDKMYKSEFALGQQMLNVENFLRNYARDVLDESDELFSVKYQLVYTIGEQVPVDGGDLRWLTCQKILDIVPKLGEILFRKFGGGKVEFQDGVQKQYPHQFSSLRLLGDETCLKEFQNLVTESILGDLRISSENDKQIVKRFLTEDQINKEEHLLVMTKLFSDDSPDVLQRILIYSGYLRRGVLGLALTKRWRVEYGVNPSQNSSRLMAIPFRAKDVAAEKTEFGHPDLAIILTHLSYYYSGLSDKQLQELLDVLKVKQAPTAIYSQWISKIPKVPSFMKSYSSLNLKDASQKATIFDTLRRHKMVIDFWLSTFVFPRESKQFPGKLVMTAWDLCYERQKHAVTGFSGTNDSQDLLPLMIKQQDLDKLKNTNERMTRTLLQPENGIYHKGLQMGVTCKDILCKMEQDKLTVLIDAGALMLECSNEQVANLWLEIDGNIEAAVYFNERNELLVKTRGDQGNGQGTPFEVSPYQGSLEKCGVFLDDQHTRGTDLKFPVDSKACVTVATRMKRDKLIQACMRMRKLGEGHSVSFYLSHEARNKITGDGICTQGVLDWVCENTKESNRDGVVFWALAGRNYAQRLTAEDHFHFPNNLSPYQGTVENGTIEGTKLRTLANHCVDDEVVKLIDMYGQHTKMELLTELVQNWFVSGKRKLKDEFNLTHIF